MLNLLGLLRGPSCTCREFIPKVQQMTLTLMCRGTGIRQGSDSFEEGRSFNDMPPGVNLGYGLGAKSANSAYQGSLFDLRCSLYCLGLHSKPDWLVKLLSLLGWWIHIMHPDRCVEICWFADGEILSCEVLNRKMSLGLEIKPVLHSRHY